MSGPIALGVDIGGTKTLAAVVNDDGSTGPIHEAPTLACDGARAVLNRAVELARSASGNRAIGQIGIGSAGVIEHRTGRVLSATSALPGWQGTDIRGAFEAAFPLATVQAINDVQAFTVAESVYGAATGAHAVLGVTAGTGIGGALLIGGEIYWGANHAAGHIGHVLVPGAEGLACPCGRVGHVEAVASGAAMTELFRGLGGTADALQDVARAAEAGDSVARAVLDRGADALGAALGSTANVLDPDAIVIGGGVTGLGDQWLDRVRAAARATTIPAIGQLRIESSVLGRAAVAAGAVLATSHLISRSSRTLKAGAQR